MYLDEKFTKIVNRYSRRNPAFAAHIFWQVSLRLQEVIDLAKQLRPMQPFVCMGAEDEAALLKWFEETERSRYPDRFER